jgi:hypothetical protein
VAAFFQGSVSTCGLTIGCQSLAASWKDDQAGHLSDPPPAASAYLHQERYDIHVASGANRLTVATG